MVLQAALVMPLKSFTHGKGRLASILDAAARERLSRECAERVVMAAGSVSIVVVTDATDSRDVRDWAENRGISCIPQTSPGLNGAVANGMQWVRRNGFDVAVVAHSDVPLATNVMEFIDDDNIVIVPDATSDGTNLMSLPTSADFSFHYGPGSFRLHVAEATKRGFAPRIALSEGWSRDVDTPEDLADERIRKVFPWLPMSRANQQ